MEQRKKTFCRIVELPCLDPPSGGVSGPNGRSRIPTKRREGTRKVRQLIWIIPIALEGSWLVGTPGGTGEQGEVQC